MGVVDDDIVVLGQFGSAHGIRGQIKVYSFTDPVENILNYQPWLVKFGQTWQQVSYIRAEKSPKFYSVLLENCKDRNTVEQYKNCKIGILKSQLKKLDEQDFYWHELIGMSVVTTEDLVLGKVVDMLETGSNDVLVVNGEKRHLIPYILDDFIVQINREGRKITVDWDPEF